MWPWEHFAIGYVAYSLMKRTFDAPPPNRWEILVLAVGTQFPDLVDKPLGWGTTLLPGGVSLAHSYLVAVPLVSLLVLLTSAVDRGWLGWAFGIGYLLHTPADIVARYLLNGELILGALVWPLVPVPSLEPQPLLGRAGELFVSYIEVLGSPEGITYLVLEAVMLGALLFAWLSDRRTRRKKTTRKSVAD